LCSWCVLFALGDEKVKTKFFLSDHTHTTEVGALVNAGAVAEGIKSLKRCKLKRYFR
jgi:rhamnogalacturonan acetylesterase